VPDTAALAQLAETVKARGWRVAAAESVTAGLVANHLAQAPAASDWFLGGVVSYATEVKTRMLGVEPGPVVNPQTAEQMARGVADLLGAQVAVATTGVGGPEPAEDQPAGRVWVGVYVDGTLTHHRLDLDGGPEDVCTGAADEALRLLVGRL
jgi:nicotinamide-nucleotide amidase